MAVNDIFQVTIQCATESNLHVNVLHYRETAGDNAVAQLTMVDEIIALWDTTVMPWCAAGTAHTKTYWQLIHPQLGGLLEVHHSPPVVGGQAGDHHPLQVSAIIQKRTNTPGRSGRGRLFFGAVSEHATVGSHLDPTYRQNLRDAFAAFAQPIHPFGGNRDWVPVVWGPLGQTSPQWVNTLVSETAGTVRSRRVRLAW